MKMKKRANEQTLAYCLIYNFCHEVGRSNGWQTLEVEIRLMELSAVDALE